jgi:hypothetical protein
MEEKMNNILQYLKPAKKDSDLYESIKAKHSLTKNLDLLWYPNSGNHYRVLYYFNIDERRHFNMNGKPDLYIFTDYLLAYSDDIKNNNILYEDKHTKIINESYVKLNFEGKIQDYFCEGFKRHTYYYRKNNYPIYLIDIKVESDKYGSFNAPVLYFIWENTAFLKAFIFERNIKIHFLQKCREYGMTCWAQMVFILYYIGLMRTKYLFLENYDYHYYRRNTFASIKADKILGNKFMDFENNIPKFHYKDSSLLKKDGSRKELYDVFENEEYEDDNKISDITFEEKFERISRRLRI